MSRTPRRLMLFLAACTFAVTTVSTSLPSSAASSTTSYPVQIKAANGTIEITSRPTAIVSLSPTATEMLYAIGAGSQVKAVDKYSDYPKSAPITSLDGNSPNIEAIAAFKPDLVIVSSETASFEKQLRSLGITVL